MAHLTNNETLVIIALISGVFTLASSWNSWQAKKNAKEARAQMHPNGGSSFRDAVTRIEGRLTAIEDYITNPKESQ